MTKEEGYIAFEEWFNGGNRGTDLESVRAVYLISPIDGVQWRKKGVEESVPCYVRRSQFYIGVISPHGSSYTNKKSSGKKKNGDEALPSRNL
ncbi:hypothetical protein OCU04_002467 [Sclerotinia nivalis]|uniref:Uncharacterized protein n=1 Tax=Sclerotinia nivalis TaxID=352851 RepID=A0A9X0ATN5_9HELO|nr:hypothetical protein OCU04_002467 [Sclerotinia nivalis]